jgi:hypothetical protein
MTISSKQALQLRARILLAGRPEDLFMKTYAESRRLGIFYKLRISIRGNNAMELYLVP